MTLEEIREQALALAEPQFKKFEPIALANTKKVLQAFKACQVSDYHFNGSSGYGYNDSGREKLDEVFAHVFKGEKALIRAHFVSGTHALATTLMALLGNGKDGNEFVYAVGAPYDTMQSVIGSTREVRGSLIEKGFIYHEVPLVDSTYDLEGIVDAVNENTRVVVIQRSRGYSTREPLSIADIRTICDVVKAKNPNTICFVDNCYGEFTEKLEPTDVGVNVVCGSLIKNPGGGLCETGGYIAGDSKIIKLCSEKLTCPGIGKECGATLDQNRNILQGLFMAPSIVKNAMMSAVFAAKMLEEQGFDVYPSAFDKRSDIVQAIKFNDKDKLITFIQQIQNESPIDSHVTPEPWAMPGYDDEVIMAAGTFIEGASIELSADSPIRAPYVAYMQGGLTYESAKLAICSAVSKIISREK